jgi:GNAT superfamily N-acetyltransferase
MAYYLKPVKDRATARDFLLLPVKLYANDPHWVRPLDGDMEKVFDPARNPHFKHGQCTRWVLVDQAGQAVGRVAAFVNDKTTWLGNDQPTGGLGFFECINDRTAAFMLFDAAKNWLQAQGMEAMDGPINFGQRDSWWGLLVDGFEPPNYGMFYHFPYYQALFEAYGFREYFRQYTYRRVVAEGLHPIVTAKANRILQNSDYEFKILDKSQLSKFAEDFRTIYNQAWVNHEGVSELSREQAQELLKQMKPILDPQAVFFGYHLGQPVAFFINIPDLNQAFKFIGTGKLNWWGLLKFAWFKLTKGFDKMIGVVFGVVPAQQGRGVEAALIEFSRTYAHRPDFPYRTLEMNWIGDFNPKMMKLSEMIGGKVAKTHATYRLLFDPAREFKKPTPIK